MSLVLAGTNHTYSPLEIREKIYFSRNRLKEALIELSHREEIKGALILSTCNRIEIYADVVNEDSGTPILKNTLLSRDNKAMYSLEPYLYIYTGKDAFFHLYKVASGIDSRIIGEREILEQLTHACEIANDTGTLNSFLRRVFYKAVDMGRKARVETRISEGDVSIGNIAVSLAKEKLGNLKDKKVLLIGTGKVIELVTENLKKENIRAVFVSSRTFEKAEKLAHSISGEAVQLESLKEHLKDADIVITATKSPHFILRKEDVLKAISYEPSAMSSRLLLIIDLAVPRDMDPDVRYIKGVSLFDIDGLDAVIEKNLARRTHAVPDVLHMIHKELDSIWLQEDLELEPEPALLP